MPHSVALGVYSALALVLSGHAATLTKTHFERITIQVVNSAKVEPSVLARAERLAAKAFAKVGIAVEWRDCGAVDCAQPAGPGEFWMHVALWRPVSTGSETLGFTFQDSPPATPGHLSGVYYPMVQQLAWDFRLDEVNILGAVLAHEIGHVLGVGHSLAGVMTAHFDHLRLVEMSAGDSWFTQDQARAMRSAIDRMQAVPAAAIEGAASR